MERRNLVLKQIQAKGNFFWFFSAAKTFNDQSCNAGEKLKNQVYIWIQNFCWKLISRSHCGTIVPTFDASFIIKATVVEILKTV